MGLFSKTSIASIYVKELRTRLDQKIVPVFPPDGEVDVGDFGSFEDGEFVVKGNVAARGVPVGELESSEVGGFDFVSSGKVEIGPTVEAPGNLAKASITFTGSRAVVASFGPGVDETVPDADAFEAALLSTWRDGTLRTDRAVVWSLRRVDSGTIIVSRDAGTTVDVMVDAAVAAAVGIALPTLALGVKFGSNSTSAWQKSESERPLVAWARLLRLRGDRAVDGFGFDRAAGDGLATASVADFTTDDLLAELAREEPARV